jgi:hypothetical protein
MLFGARKPDLSTRDAFGAFEDEVAALIRAFAFDQAGRLLLNAMSGFVEKACRRIANSYVAIDGWDEVWADMANPRRDGGHITAFGIDLSGYGDGPEPVLECAMYGDDAFDFKAATRESLIAAMDGGPAWNRRHTPPWTGNFIDSSARLQVRGLSGVVRALAHCPQSGPGAAGSALAKWYIVLRVHHAIARDLKKRGMPRAMPILIGDHGFGPGLQSVYMAQTGASRDKAVAAILQTRARRSAKAFDRQTDEMLSEFRFRRKSVRNWPAGLNPDKRRMFVDLAEMRERLALSALHLPPHAPGWELDDAAFKALLEDIRAARLRHRGRP